MPSSIKRLDYLPKTSPFSHPLAKHKRVRAISITLDLSGQKSPIRKFNHAATESETQCAEGG